MFDSITLCPLGPGRNRRSAGPRCVRAALLLGLAMAVAHADIQGPTGDDKDRRRGVRDESLRRVIDIPTPKDAAVSVVRGKPTDIVLEATSGLRQSVEFRLSTPPRAGRLTSIRSVANERAVVTYTAGAGGATQDSFTFRVKHRDSATSGSAVVRITIIDPKPELHVIGQADFGEVILGETVQRPLVLENKGLGDYQAMIELPPPWTLVTGGLPLTVPAGGKVEVPLAVRPQFVGPADFTLRYPGLPGVATKLTVLGVSPLQVEPVSLPATWRPADRTRRAEMTLANRSSLPLDYRISAPPRLTLSAGRGTLEPHARQKIELVLPEGDPAELNGLITVLARDTRVEATFLAPAAPAWLRLREADKFTRSGEDYLLPEDGAPATLLLENVGGHAAPLEVTAPDGFTLIAFENGQDFAPGDVRRLSLRTTRSGQVRGVLQAALGEHKLTFPLCSSTPEPAPAASTPPEPETGHASAPTARRPTRTAPTRAEKKTLMTADVVGVFPAGMAQNDSLPELPYFTPGKLTSQSFEFSFPSAGAEYGYVIFREEYRPSKSTGRPMRYWIPWEGVTFKPAGKDIVAKLDHLVPGRKYIIRFAVRATDGRMGPPSVPTKFVTPLPQPWPWGWTLSLALFAALGWWGWRRWQRQYE